MILIRVASVNVTRTRLFSEITKLPVALITRLISYVTIEEHVSVAYANASRARTQQRYDN